MTDTKPDQNTPLKLNSRDVLSYLIAIYKHIDLQLFSLTVPSSRSMTLEEITKIIPEYYENAVGCLYIANGDPQKARKIFDITSNPLERPQPDRPYYGSKVFWYSFDLDGNPRKYTFYDPRGFEERF